MINSMLKEDVPSLKDLYKRLVNKVTTTEPLKRLQLKQQMQNKYLQHISLLESHKRRELRFESNYQYVNRKQQQKKRSLENIIREKQDSIKKSRLNQLNVKKKKMEDYLVIWKNTVNMNKKKYQIYVKDSGHIIKKWNQKCENSINKKKQRLDSVSSRISERSQLSSAKTIKYQEQQYQKMLQRSLLNPQSSRSKLKDKFSSRISTTSNVSIDRNRENYQRMEMNKKESVLSKLLGKQSRIIQARNKKNQLIDKLRNKHHNKQKQLSYLHTENNRNLHNIREDMEHRLDNKYKKERKFKKIVNRSSPAMSPKSILLDKGRQQHRLPLIEPKARTVEHNFDRLIMDELRSISIVSRIKKKLK